MVEPGTKAAVLRQCHDLERIAGGGFDQDRHHVPGWMVVEMLMRPPHDARDHGRVDTGKPRRQALRDAVNGSQLGVGRHASTLPQGSCPVNPAFVWSARRMWGQRLRTEARPAGPWRTANGRRSGLAPEACPQFVHDPADTSPEPVGRASIKVPSEGPAQRPSTVRSPLPRGMDGGSPRPFGLVATHWPNAYHARLVAAVSIDALSSRQVAGAGVRLVRRRCPLGRGTSTGHLAGDQVSRCWRVLQISGRRSGRPRAVKDADRSRQVDTRGALGRSPFRSVAGAASIQPFIPYVAPVPGQPAVPSRPCRRGANTSRDDSSGRPLDAQPFDTDIRRSPLPLMFPSSRAPAWVDSCPARSGGAGKGMDGRSIKAVQDSGIPYLRLPPPIAMRSRGAGWAEPAMAKPGRSRPRAPGIVSAAERPLDGRGYSGASNELPRRPWWLVHCLLAAAASGGV